MRRDGIESGRPDAQDGGWRVDAVPWLFVAAVNRREALGEARAAIAAWLEVEPDAFDLAT